MQINHLLVVLFAAQLILHAQAQPQLIQRAPSTAAIQTLGPGDTVVVQVQHSDEFDGKPLRISFDGAITLPYIGKVRATGLTPQQLEQEIARKLDVYYRDPVVSVAVAEWRSQPVSVVGAVNSPGVHQLEGQKTLIEVIAMAGGLKESAAYRIMLTRDAVWGSDELPGAKLTPDGRHYTAEISVNDLMRGSSQIVTMPVKPNDVITVPTGEMLYVIGEILKPGGYVLDSSETVSVLQALAMAQGATPLAGLKNARILRETEPNQERQEIPVDLKAILNGDSGDVRLRAGDILFVPNNTLKSTALKAASIAVQIGTGLVIWRR